MMGSPFLDQMPRLYQGLAVKSPLPEQSGVLSEKGPGKQFCHGTVFKDDYSTGNNLIKYSSISGCG